jgi:hypothetical protein
LVVAVLAGLGFGGAFAMLSTARRTATAHERYLRSVHAYDYSTAFEPHMLGEPIDRLVDGKSGLAEHQQVIGYSMRIEGLELVDIPFQWGWFGNVARMERPEVLTGRLPRANAPDEAVVNEVGARRSGVKPGQRLRVQLQAPDEKFEFHPRGDPVDLHVVGVVRMPDEYLLDQYREQGLLILSPAFVNQHLDVAVWGNVHMRMMPGASPRAVQAALATTGLAFDEDRTHERDRVWQSVRPLVTVIAIIGGLALVAVSTLLALTQVRQRQRYANDDEGVRALGASPADLRVERLARGGLLGLATAVVAVVVAYLLSSVVSAGPFRKVDPGRGQHFDTTVLLGGAAFIVVIVLVVALFDSRARADRPTTRAGFAVPAAPLPWRLGLGMAFGAGRSVPAAFAVTAGMAVAAAVVVTAIVFVGSLRELGGRPVWYGQTWDAVARIPYGSLDPGSLRLDGSEVEGWVKATIEGGSVDGAPVPMLALGGGRGGPEWPLVVEGRAPRQPGEVLVGRDVLAEIGRGVGDEVTLRTQDVGAGDTISWTARVVGVAVFPNIGSKGIDPPRLGRGVAMSLEESLRRKPPGDTGTYVLVKVAKGVDPVKFAGARSGGEAGGGAFQTDWLLDLRPVEIDQVSGTSPLLWATLAGIGVVAALMLAHMLATSLRDRRRDYAVLRVLGFTGGQLRATLFAQAYSATGAAVITGLVLGIASGRALWTAFARQLDVLARPTVPVAELALVLLAGAVAVAVVAAPWAWRVRHIPSAQVLRTE